MLVMETVLKPEHQFEVQKFLLFFKQKREESLREADAALSQFASQSVTDLMMSKDEVMELLKAMTSELKTTLEAELANIVRMSAIYIRTLLYQGEQQGMSFQADTSYLENQRMIEEMAKIEKHQKTLAELSRAPSGGARLPTLQSGFSNDPTLIQELREKKEEVNQLKERLSRLQVQLSTAMADKEELTEKVAHLEATQTQHHEEDDSQAREMTAELFQAKVTITQLALETKEGLLAQLKQEQEKRLNESKQFQSLKKLIQTKNDQLKELRARLEKYEPPE